MTSIDLLLKNLRGKNLRITRLRRLIFEILSDSKIPLSAGELLDLLLKLDLKVHKTSVYRQLNILREQGIIREIQLGESKKRYEIVTSDHHHHIICVGCGNIEDITLEKDLDKQEREIARQKNFKVLNHSLEFFGLCTKCNN